MSLFNMHDLLAHISQISTYLPALIITSGLVILVGCAVGCCSGPCKEKDDIFHREVY